MLFVQLLIKLVTATREHDSQHQNGNLNEHSQHKEHSQDISSDGSVEKRHGCKKRFMGLLKRRSENTGPKKKDLETKNIMDSKVSDLQHIDVNLIFMDTSMVKTSENGTKKNSWYILSACKKDKMEDYLLRREEQKKIMEIYLLFKKKKLPYTKFSFNFPENSSKTDEKVKRFNIQIVNKTDGETKRRLIESIVFITGEEEINTELSIERVDP